MRGTFFCVLAGVAAMASPAAAVPSFAVQTGRPCVACHVGGFGPQLTPFGRQFKISGYTMRMTGFNLPVSAMAVASYVKTKQDQAPAPGFDANDNVALDQISLFVSGGLGKHLGAFVQTTYDGIAKAWHWDNLDARVVTNTTIKGKPVVLGLSLNNAPTVQDAFNTLPAWGFPYTGSALAPSPGASPLVGHLAQNTLGLTAYAWINSQVYAEFGGYRSPGANFLTRAGIDPLNPGQIDGVAPYARLAYQKDFGDSNVEVGAFLLHANLFPGRDRTTGLSDHYSDLGLDASYQRFGADKSVVTVNGRYTHEAQGLDASQALGLASHADNTLQDARIDASYYWRGVIGASVGGFNTWGSRDDLLYGANRTVRPDSSGLTFQIDGTPFGAGGSPLGRRFNMRVGLQYIAYLRFDGAGSDYDGLGHNASDNNTFRVFTWVAY